MVLNRVCENPKNPVFNHFLFEAVAAIVRRACERNPSLVPAFEACLLPSLQMILAKEVTEFFPYAFQLLAQLVDLNRPPVPPHYMQIFDILLTPDLWKKSANVPALVRLLQSFLQRASNELQREGRLVQVIGIFNQLVSSPSTEEQGFHILNPLIENLRYDVIAEYMNHVWASLFTRLQNSKTPRLVRCLIIFMSLFLVKHGIQTHVDSINSVQPNLFHAILSQFWIPDLKTITGNIEVKLSAVASSKLLCESQSLLDPAAEELWGKLLDAIVTLLSQPEEQRVEDESEVPDFGEATGYQAVFVRLHNAGKREEDPLKEIQDPKNYTVALLANLSLQFRGRFPPVITRDLSQANQAALLQLCNSYNLAIA
ncbi:exportin-2-like [Rutidosis leptorrhynchoides]|uniref:exportin-2-like n=1 Tax=Rutidosis leptorrhynchoides TaxID=125765 RepID=UPI003A9903C8